MCLIGVTMDDEHLQEHMEDPSKMVGTLKSSIRLGFSPLSHAAIGGNPHLWNRPYLPSGKLI